MDDRSNFFTAIRTIRERARLLEGAQRSAH
jgi:hypothetical protein